jgi:hypothetical protein
MNAPDTSFEDTINDSLENRILWFVGLQSFFLLKATKLALHEVVR